MDEKDDNSPKKYYFRDRKKNIENKQKRENEMKDLDVYLENEPKVSAQNDVWWMELEYPPKNAREHGKYYAIAVSAVLDGDKSRNDIYGEGKQARYYVMVRYVKGR